MMSYNPFHKPLASLDGRFAKYILVPTRHQETAAIDDGDDLVPMDHCPESPIESRLPRDREDPCSFRTRLMDSQVDLEVEEANLEADAKAKAGTRLAFESTDLLESEDVNFDDSQCISVGWTKNRLGAMFRTPTRSENCEGAGEGDSRSVKRLNTYQAFALIGNSSANSKEQHTPMAEQSSPTATATISSTDRLVNNMVRQETIDEANSDDRDDGYNASSPMESMNMPFWTLPPRQKKQRAHHNPHSDEYVGDNDDDDDMSIITDISLIPTYFPSDVMRQTSHPYNNSNHNNYQQNLSDRTHQHRALLKRVLRGHTYAAKQTMRRLKRSCRDAVEGVFIRHHGDVNDSNNLSTATTIGVGLMGRGRPWSPAPTRCVAVAVGVV